MRGAVPALSPSNLQIAARHRRFQLAGTIREHRRLQGRAEGSERLVAVWKRLPGTFGLAVGGRRGWQGRNRVSAYPYPCHCRRFGRP
jgi:hypothetical protein